MDDSKIFMFPDCGTSKTSSDVNSLLPLLMCNGGFGGGNWVWIIFLFFLYPLMRNGGLFGNFGQNGAGCLGPLANMVNNNDGRDLLMQAINGNGAATQRLATMFGTKVDMIQAAIANVSNGITQVGCKIDSSTGALLNATIQQTDTIKESVNGVGNAVTRGFSDVGYALRDQTCNLDRSIDGVGDRIIAKLDASEKAAMQDKINALQTQLTTEHQSGVIAQQIAAAVNPIAQAVNEIKCAQPQTVTVPYQPFQAVPNCVAYQYGMYNGCNNINGFWL